MYESNVKNFLIFFILVISVSCSKNDSGKGYGLCKEGETRCTGNKLEVCSSFLEWALKTECDFYGGECITDGENSYCTNIDNDSEWFDGNFDWGENENEDDNYVKDDDFNSQDNDFDVKYEQEVTENDFEDYDIYDIEIIDEDVIQSVCGNGELESGEVCEKGTLINCVEIDSEKYTGGKAFCLDDCSGYDTITCS